MSMATGTAETAAEDLRKTVSLGREPEFTSQPTNDQLFEMVMALSAEVSVLRDRLDTHERLAQDQRPALTQHVEDYEPTPEVMEARSQRRQALLTKIFRPIRQAALRQLLGRQDSPQQVAQ